MNGYLITDHKGRRGAPSNTRWLRRGYRSYSIEWQTRHPTDEQYVLGHVISAHVGEPKSLNIQGTGRRKRRFVELLCVKTFVFIPIDGQFRDGALLLNYTDFAKPRMHDHLEVTCAFGSPRWNGPWDAHVKSQTGRSDYPASKDSNIPDETREFVIDFGKCQSLAKAAARGEPRPFIDWLREYVPLVEKRLSGFNPKPPCATDRQ